MKPVKKKIEGRLKRCSVPNYERVPRWLVLQQEIDRRLYILEEMVGQNKARTPIEQMIDEATGFDKQNEEEGEDLIAELRWLKREFDKETATPPKTLLEEDLK